MIVVTGASGFIGSNIIAGLNSAGISDILAVDDLTNGRKVANLRNVKIDDYCDKEDFIHRVELDWYPKIEAIIHMGACSATTEWDGKLLMKNNFEYSKCLLHACIKRNINFIYASSASVYGNTTLPFIEKEENEKPLNMYAYSKYLFDRYARKYIGNTENQIIGMRFFNVYGAGESHKKNMTSPIYGFYQQLHSTGKISLFKSTNTIYRRDFIYIQDCIKICLWFMKNPKISGIFNVGTGISSSFDKVAQEIIKFEKERVTSKFNNLSESLLLNYIDFPTDLVGAYQEYTCADIGSLRSVGYTDSFIAIEEGIRSYLSYISGK